MELKSLENLCVKYWWLAALIFIFWFSFYIRSVAIVPDRLLSFDPIFQYRYTWYFANWGHLPVWDELTYYAGRAVNFPPLMHYITAIFYWIFKGFGTLKTIAAYSAAIYGAAIIVPAFLFARELSNKYGGLLAAVLVGTAPQILSRTFGSSYDTDQIALFFILLTLYLGVYALRKKTIFSFCMALVGFSMFMLAWDVYFYTYFIILGSVIIYFILELARKGSFEDKLKSSFKEFKSKISILIGFFVGIFVTGLILQRDVLSSLIGLFGFATKPEAWIVNISIAELQLVNLFEIGTWILSMGRFAIGDSIIDNLVFLCFISLIGFGLFMSFKKATLFKNSVILSTLLLSFYTISRGIRFTEFSSAIFAVLIAVGFGYFVDYAKRNHFLKSFSLGLGLLISLLGISVSLYMSQGLGPDMSSNWDGAWNFLKTQTPEMSLVGTWWDPGHMVTGLAERRVIGDGAHCGNECFYSINDRITTLGKIFATEDENESVELIRKYIGTSPKMYWIASNDLIGKYQWLQYFGTGCDGRREERCPLYWYLGQQEAKYTASGEVAAIIYGNVILLSGRVPFPILTQGKNAVVFKEMLFYDNGQIKSLDFEQFNQTELIGYLSPMIKQLGYSLTNKTLDLTIWVPNHYGYVVIIPKNLRNNMFTKTFFLEGAGLEKYKQVFRNEEVKIYEVKI